MTVKLYTGTKTNLYKTNKSLTYITYVQTDRDEKEMFLHLMKYMCRDNIYLSTLAIDNPKADMSCRNETQEHTLHGFLD